jgi:tetratricopeptide (TPR) repeat protein
MRLAKTYLRPAPTTRIPVTRPPRPAASPRPPEATPLEAAREHLAAGDHERALVAFDEALARAPRIALAHLGRAVCLFALARDDEGLVALDAALSVGEDGEALLAVARACAGMGRDGLAMDLLALALGAFPDAAPSVAKDPGFTRLRDHPRFLQLVGLL